MTPQEELRKFRESQLSPQELLRKFRESQPERGFLGASRPPSFDELLSTSKEQDENFDYETGARGGLRAK